MSGDYYQAINKNQVRIAERQCWVITEPLAFEYIRHYEV
jgi:hypothetical protein